MRRAEGRGCYYIIIIDRAGGGVVYAIPFLLLETPGQTEQAWPTALRLSLPLGRTPVLIDRLACVAHGMHTVDPSLATSDGNVCVYVWLANRSQSTARLQADRCRAPAARWK